MERDHNRIWDEFLHADVQKLWNEWLDFKTDLAIEHFWLENKANFNTNQPRVPRGHSDGGQWTKVGADNPKDVDAAFLRLRGELRKIYVLRGGGGSGYFSVRPNPDANDKAPWFESRWFEGVNKYNDFIEYAAGVVGVEANLIRAIVYMETTHGYYDRGFAIVGANSSILPMNINMEYWGDAFGTREDLKNSLHNIIAGARVLKGIQNNLPTDATVAQIATLYNSLNASHVTIYGARVQFIYDHKLWEFAE